MSETPPNPEEPVVDPVTETVLEPTLEAVAEAPVEAVAEAAAEPAATLEPTPAVPAAPAVPELSPAECAEQLTQRFPALFAAGRALPIKLRVHADIQARAPGVFTRKALSLFLHRYTTTTAYLKALVSEKQRFDLDGAPAGEVADEHRIAAQEEVERRRAIVQAKRQSQRPQAQPQQRPEQSPEQRPDQAPRHERPQQPRRDGPPRQDGAPPARPRFQKPRAGAPQAPRPPPPPRPDDAEHREHRQAAPVAAMPAALAMPEDPARRERAVLLRSFETSTLTKANFCVLKRIAEPELDAQLAQARQERGERPVRPPR